MTNPLSIIIKKPEVVKARKMEDLRIFAVVPNYNSNRT